MEENVKAALYYELVEKCIKRRNNTALMYGITAFLALLMAAVVLGAGVSQFAGAGITPATLTALAVLSGVSVFLFGYAIFTAILGVAEYFDTQTAIDESEALYMEVVK